MEDKNSRKEISYYDEIQKFIKKEDIIMIHYLNFKGKIIMNCNSEILINKFKEIAKKRWIPSVNNNSNGVGLTF